MNDRDYITNTLSPPPVKADNAGERKKLKAMLRELPDAKRAVSGFAFKKQTRKQGRIAELSNNCFKGHGSLF
jgi:hypothetical protein